MVALYMPLHMYVPLGGCTYIIADGRTREFRPGSVVNQYTSRTGVCTPCLCFFDTWRCNTDVNLPKRECDIRDEPLQNCTYINDKGERERLAHGMRKRARCNNTCSCVDGDLVCTSLKCDDDKDNDECGRCDSQHVFMPVCGNGKEYKSRCHAMHCGNLTASDFTDRPCTVSTRRRCELH